MALTRLDNLYSSKTGKYLYVSPDDFNATDALDNRGNSPLRPFKTIQRAFIEVSRYSYIPGPGKVDRFDQFSIMLMPGNHYIDNRPGLIDTTGISEFGFDSTLNQWTDNSKVDLSDPDNVLYKFNAKTGGAIVPRGCSLIGYDLRRTVVRPLYVPDPVDTDVERTSIFNLTGGCYLWQFTIKDGDVLDTSPLYNSAEGVAKVYSQPDGTGLVVPEFSHHKICIMEYAENQELDLYYEKIGKAFSKFQPTIDDDGELDPLVQENRIVGPLSDSRSIDSLKIEDVGGSRAKVTITTKIEHGYFEGQFVAVLNTGLDEELNGTFKISLVGANNPKVFTYFVDTVSAAIGLTSGSTYTTSTVPDTLGANAISLAEIDSVESASPYVFNCSIRSTWGQCGMWANGSKATGFRSMVVAQYTGVSLQKDDRAFIRYDRFTNTWNEASLTDAFATVPYHTKGDAYWKDDWRNFHIRASDDAFIQCVSVFAVGFFDHFLMESGGDMSITNSNSNFGNTSLHAVGFKGFAFNQDKGGYITDIIPPKILNTNRAVAERVQYYVFDIPSSNSIDNNTRLYLGSSNEEAENRPAATISGYRIGARSGEKIYANLEPAVPAGPTEFSATLSPSGFKRYATSLSILNPVTIGNFVDNKAQDSANRINDNKELIQSETYRYILDKYPYLNPDDPSFTGTIDIAKCQRDVGYFVDAVVKDLRLTLDTSTIPTDFSATSNINVIQAAEGYYVGGQLDFIENELTETLEALDYVKNLAIAAMRNWDYLIGPVGGFGGCNILAGQSVVNVGDTTGLVLGMSVAEYSQTDFTNNKLNSGATPNTTRIPAGAFISEIIDDQNIRLSTNAGNIVAGGTNNNAYLYFVLETGYFDPSLTPSADYTITQDTAYPECGNISTLIQSYFADIASILSNGLTDNGVQRRESAVNTADLAVRATVFTVNTGGGLSNPHRFETGTPVRLVPRAKAGTNPDKRLIRLPNGFNPNQKYYVIAPGRKTYPFDYSDTADFNGTDQTKLMLATSVENATAGIYIYSPETDTIDTDVEIDLYQYVLDGTYDLHKYTCNVASAGVIETDVSHVFDLPKNGSTPHKVFFRVASDINGSSLPSISGQGTIDPQQIYYARYIKDTGSIAQKKFTIHPTFDDAINDDNQVVFQTGTGSDFYVFADKRESPLRFDPEIGSTGSWYLNVEDESSGNNPRTDSILYRFHLPDYDDASGKQKTNDTFYERIADPREKEDRVYRLRYVIPQYLSTVRDPLNGFVIKIRTDETRRLVPQKLVLKPVGAAPSFCELRNPSNTEEILGLREDEYPSTVIPSYDPYVNPIVIETESKIAFSVQSAQKKNVDGTDYLEITAIDHTTINQNLKGKLFYALKITEPQGGTFNSSTTLSNATNEVTWTGNCSGVGYIQSVITNVIDAETIEYYMILKDITGTLEFSSFNLTTFSQQGGAVTTTLAAKPDSIGDPDGKSKSSRDDYLYAIPKAGVYTAVPGDTITVATQGGNVQYIIDSVDDVIDIDDTFYVFDIDEIQERIAGQQDGIYYLTCVRGNISPFPQGPGIGNNFRNFKFSQPISQLYPLSYKNDPLWFKDLEPEAVDPPATVSAADNYVHGLVTVNDYKNSETKESTIDFLNNLGEVTNYEDAGIEFNLIKGQSGNATSGSEDRKIPIYGVKDTPNQSKLYVELRRPSIARSGNHTFEYLGFGPGNYSTGFPLRQEVILSDKQDFYAQSKKEDGGIVFYTGLNSNGDLYIGNRKINAITGEETFLEAAVLAESEDDNDDIGTIVTTFDTAVTFNDKITVNGKTFLNDEVEINVDPTKGEALRIYSKITAGDDVTLSRASFADPDSGDVVIQKNRIDAAVFAFNPRGNAGFPGQSYTIRTHTFGVTPTNKTPDQGGTFGNDQIVFFGSTLPATGDIVIKGREVGKSGSLGWIYANVFTNINPANIASVTTDGTNIVRITWEAGLLNTNIGAEGIKLNSNIRIQGNSVTALNGTWPVFSATYSSTAGYVDIIVQNTITQDNTIWPSGASLELSESRWKETGVIGAEALRTDTSKIGEYRLGINTVARALHTAYNTAFVSAETDPKANLDVVGNAFISGKKILDYTNPTNAGFSKTLTAQDHAFLVGGSADTPDSAATFRVMTTNNGRVGINTQVNNSSPTNLDRTLTIIGDARVTENFKFGDDINLDGPGLSGTVAINTTITDGTINILNNSTFIGLLTLANYPTTIEAFARATDLEIANQTSQLDLKIANAATNLDFDFGTNTDIADIDMLSNASEVIIDLAPSTSNLQLNIGNPSTSSANVSVVAVGGGYLGSSTSSLFVAKTNTSSFWGDVVLGSNKSISETLNITTQAGTVNFLSNSGVAAEVDIAANASLLKLAGQGGLTNIRNSLQVDATAEVRGNLFHNGGTSSFDFDGDRAQQGTTIQSHTGQINPPLDKNIDFARFRQGFDINLDTAGFGPWGSSVFQNAITGINDDLGNPLGALSGNQYYLPLNESPNKTITTRLTESWAEGDDFIITSPEGIGTFPEIVKIAQGGLIKVNTPPYYVIVERQPYGTFLPINTNHPDETPIRKVIVSLDAGWLTEPVDGSGTSDLFKLSEFGGGLNAGDFLFVSRSADGTTGESVKVTAFSGVFTKTFRVEDGADDITFQVDSVTGRTSISNSVVNGGLIGFGPFEFTATCSVPAAERQFTLKNGTIDTFNVDMCDGEITVAQGTIDTDVSILQGTTTWNNVSIDFDAIKVNVTDTFSATNSNLLRLSVDGVDQFIVRKNGDTIIDGSLTTDNFVTNPGDGTTFNDDVLINGDLEVAGNTTLRQDLLVEGLFTVTGNLQFGGSLLLGDDFEIRDTLSGDTYFFVDAQTGSTVIGNLSGSGSLLVYNDADIRDNLLVGSNATISGDLEVNGGDIISNAVTFNLLTTTVNDLNIGLVADDIVIGSDVPGSETTIRTQNVTLNGSLAVNVDIDVAGNSIFRGDTDIRGSLDLTDDLRITDGFGGRTYFLVDAQTGNTTIGNGNSGILKIESDLDVSAGEASIVTDGGVLISKQLVIGGNVSVNNGVFTIDATNGDTSATGSLSIGGDFNFLNNNSFSVEYASGNVTIGGNITVDGNKFVVTQSNGNVSMAGSLTVQGNAQITGGNITTNQTNFNLLNTNVTVLNFASTASDINIGANDGNTTIRHDLDVGGALEVQDSLTLNNNFVINSFNTQSGTTDTNFRVLAASGNTTTQGTLRVNSADESTGRGTGALVVGGGASVGGNLNVGGTVDIADGTIVLTNTGNITADGSLTIQGAFGITNNFTVDTNGNIGSNGGLTFNGDFTNGGTFTIERSSGNTDINGTLDIGGSFTVNNTAFTVNSGNGDTVVGGTLQVDARTTITENSLVSTNSSFDILPTGASSVNFALVAGNLTIGSLSGTTNIRNNVIIGSSDGTNRKDLTVSDQLIIGNDFEVRNSVGSTGTVFFTVDAATGNTVIGRIDQTTNPPTHDGTLEVLSDDDATSLGRGAFITEGGASIAKNLFIGGNIEVDNGVDTPFELNASTGNLTITGSFTFNGDFDNGETFEIERATGNTEISGTLDVANGFDVNSGAFTVDVLGNTVIDATLSVDGNLSVGGSEFTVDAGNGNTVIGGTLNVGSSFAIATNKFTVNATNGNTVIDGTLSVSGGNLTIDSSGNLTTSNNITAGGDLAVNGDSITTTRTGTFSIINANATGLNLAGAATTINIGSSTGNTTINNSLTVGSNITIAGTLDVAGNIDLNNGGISYFSVDSSTGNTIIGNNNSGTLRIESNQDISGSSASLSTDGGAIIAKKLQVGDDLAVNGNDITTTASGTFNLLTSSTVDTANIFTGAETVNIGNTNSIVDIRDRLVVNGITEIDGQLTVANNISVTGSGTISGNLSVGSNFAVSGAGTITGELTVNGGQIELNNGANPVFRVKSNGAIDAFVGPDGNIINDFFQPSGARKWEVIPISSEANPLTPNVGYFVSTGTTAYLPSSPTTGDMISFIDITGNLNFNTFLIVKGAAGQTVQGSNSGSLATGTGGELIVNTPNAAFSLVWSGSGWHLTNV